jgi:hypothetical protein
MRAGIVGINHGLSLQHAMLFDVISATNETPSGPPSHRHSAAAVHRYVLNVSPELPWLSLQRWRKTQLDAVAQLPQRSCL